MVHLSRYWEILRLDPTGRSPGYRCQLVTPALELIREQFPDMYAIAKQPGSIIPPHRAIQMLLFSLFRAASDELTTIAKAGLCLRCYVSYPILNACKKIARQFSASGRFSYQDLLPFVLSDDGQSLIIMHSDGKTQLVLKGSNTAPVSFSLFTVEVLRKYDHTQTVHSSLDSWAYYQTRQNQELKDFLSEQGLSYLSDWALLNRARAKQIETLPPYERQIIEAFHAVYRRDRRHNHAIATRCPDPTFAQLQEMLHLLQNAGSPVRSPEQLIDALKQIAKQFRQYEVWNRGGPASEPLETTHPDSEIHRELPDPTTSNTLEDIERQEVREFCQQQLIASLDWGIAQALRDQLCNLKQRPRFAALASKFIPALQLIYCQGLSQSEVASRLEMKNQSQVSRVINVRNLLQQVRFQTIERLFQTLLEMALNLDSNQTSNTPDYHHHLRNLVERFADEEIFQDAAAEIMTTKNRSLNSAYAQRLRCHIQDPQECSYD